MTASPQVLTLLSPRRPAVEPEEEQPLGPGQVRPQTRHAGASVGTKVTSYRGTNPHLHKEWDPRTRLFRAGEAPTPYPVRGWGCEVVGTVTQDADADAED